MTQTRLFDFDTVPERRHTGSAKWNVYDEDVIPLWVADMDFKAPPAVVDALRTAVDHGVFGYMMPPGDLRGVLVDRMKQLYDWDIKPEDIIYTPGVIVGINMAAKGIVQGGAILVQPPVYHPFHDIPYYSQCSKQEAPLTYVQTDDGFSYEIDFEAFEAAITPETRMFLLCNPHNPIGRVWTRDELARMAEICARHDVVICSDEIHCDLVMSGHTHTPMASLSPEIAQRTVTLMAPSKTFNVPGLTFSFAIVQNEALRNQVLQAAQGLTAMVKPEYTSYSVNMMGYIATNAAYQHGAEWLEAVLAYIEANRDFAYAYIQDNMPAIKCSRLEGTYLLFLDCRALALDKPVGQWFLEHARVALNDGGMFGQGGEGFARVNLACSRATLEEALNRMCTALKSAATTA